MGRVFQVEWRKLRRTWVWPLIGLGPFGVLSLNWLRYTIDAYRPVHGWPWLIGGVGSVLVPSLVIGVTIIASLIAGMEHRGRMWKELLTLPVPKASLYGAKLLMLATLLALAAGACAGGTWLLGLGLGYPPGIPWAAILQVAFYPYLAAYALMALQLLLSVIWPNQAVAVAIGIAGLLAAMLPFTPDWLPWRYPELALAQGSGPALPQYVLLGVALGAALTLVGLWSFQRQDHP